ncbi:MAG: hypothetical protein EHM45_08060 [Desulfobacteraceae bacterium]|nr:MAG: hypothetical protein EHM45_08060 [Desulfobacteraceae bacterium]
MGKNITIYFDDELLQFLESQKESSGAVVKKAIRQLMKKNRPQRYFDEVLKAAVQIGKNEKFEQAIKEWAIERKHDR